VEGGVIHRFGPDGADTKERRLQCRQKIPDRKNRQKSRAKKIAGGKFRSNGLLDVCFKRPLQHPPVRFGEDCRKPQPEILGGSRTRRIKGTRPPRSSEENSIRKAVRESL